MKTDVTPAEDSQNWLEIDEDEVCSWLGEVATMEMI